MITCIFCNACSFEKWVSNGLNIFCVWLTLPHTSKWPKLTYIHANMNTIQAYTPDKTWKHILCIITHDYIWYDVLLCESYTPTNTWKFSTNFPASKPMQLCIYIFTMILHQYRDSYRCTCMLVWCIWSPLWVMHMCNCICIHYGN